MQSFSDCISGWSKEPQWENKLWSFFLPCFLPVEKRWANICFSTQSPNNPTAGTERKSWWDRGMSLDSPPPPQLIDLTMQVALWGFVEEGSRSRRLLNLAMVAHLWGIWWRPWWWWWWRVAPCGVMCARKEMHGLGSSPPANVARANLMWRPRWVCCNAVVWLLYDRNSRAKSVFKIQVFNALQTQNWSFKIHLSQNNPSKCNPRLKMKTSLEVLNIICPPQEPTSIGHCHYKKWS